MTISPKKQPATINTNTAADVNPATFAATFAYELKALAAAVRADLPSYDLNKGYVDTVNITINKFVKSRYGLTAERNSGDGYSIAQMYARVFSANAPKTNYDDVKNTVLPMLERGLWCLGAIPKITTATTGRSKTSLPFERDDIVNAMRPFVEAEDKRGQAVIKTWESLAKNGDDQLFIDKYVLEILDDEGLLFAAVDSLKEAKRIADEMAENDRKALLDGLETSYKVVKKSKA
jgi:hypothetical protein